MGEGPGRGRRFVKREKIKGKAFAIYWSWDDDRHWLRWARLGRAIASHRVRPSGVLSRRRSVRSSTS